MQKTISLILLFCCVGFFYGGRIDAKEADLNIVLVMGQVHLLEKNGDRLPVVSGRAINSEKISSIEIGKESFIYLQKGNHLYQLQTAGIIPLSSLSQHTSFSYQKAIQFLKELVTPRRFVKRMRVRGDPVSPATADNAYFELLWQQIIVERSDGNSKFPPDTFLAAAAWYEQNGNRARVAYILERLDTVTRQQNEFYGQLRLESHRGTTLTAINQEVTDTKNRLASNVTPLHYKALLIGIDKYTNPYWQDLENPVRDVRRLNAILQTDYGLAQKDILILENPAFDDIIAAFQSLKQSVNPDTSLFIYYAGHGYYPTDEKEGYWIPGDAGEPNSLRLFLSTSTVLSKVNAIKSRHTLLIADSCFSGSLIRKTRSAVVNSRYYRELSQKKSRQIITSGGLEPVSDKGGDGHSLFAQQLINILSEKTREPLSASELALKLRKSVKNADYPQTPEYGRLHIADDEAGEFFFVRNDLQFASTSLETADQELINKKSDSESGETRQSKDDEYLEFRIKIPKSEPFQSEGKLTAWQAGFLFHRANLQYNMPFLNSDTQKPDTVKIDSSLEGSAISGEFRKTSDRLGFGVHLTLGQLHQMSICAESEEFDSFNGIPTCNSDEGGQSFGDQEQNLALSGQFSQLGIFADYSVIRKRIFSMQVGGELQYQMYEVNNFLGLNKAIANSLSACGVFGVSLRYAPWTARFTSNLCLPPVFKSGSLFEVDNAAASDVGMTYTANFGLSAVYDFKN
jgi:hypothetical protein